MSDRSTALETIEGPRVYRPAPNHIIVRVREVERTKAGLFLPGGGRSTGDDGHRLPPAIGEVVCVGHVLGEKWPEYEDEHGAYVHVGDVVLFHPHVLPIMPMHDGLFIVPIDMVYLVVDQAQGSLEFARAAHSPGELLWEPQAPQDGVAPELEPANALGSE